MIKRPEVVVITGASAGVGRATVRAFAKKGAHVGLLGRGAEGLEAAKQEVEASGGKAIALPVDVANAEQVEAAAAAVEQNFGPIDIWLNNAMTSVFSPVREMTAEEFRRVTEVTYLGCVYGALAALRRMLPRNAGVIVQVGSALAYCGIPLQAAYCGANHAIQGFTESLRCELLHDASRVRVMMVQLPALNTPQFSWVKSRLPNKPQPVPPIFQPEVAADAMFGRRNIIAPRCMWDGRGSRPSSVTRSRLDWRMRISLRQVTNRNKPTSPRTVTGPTISGSRYGAITVRTASSTPGLIIGAGNFG